METMSPTSINPLERRGEERRSYPRRRLDRPAYVDFGPDNGGILTDVSEDGLNCQVVGALIEGQFCHLGFILPGTNAAIESIGKIIWSDASKRSGGTTALEPLRRRPAAP